MIPKNELYKLSQFLEGQGYKREAMEISQDIFKKIDLALELELVDVYHSRRRWMGIESYWVSEHSHHRQCSSSEGNSCLLEPSKWIVSSQGRYWECKGMNLKRKRERIDLWCERKGLLLPAITVPFGGRPWWTRRGIQALQGERSLQPRVYCVVISRRAQALHRVLTVAGSLLWSMFSMNWLRLS